MSVVIIDRNVVNIGDFVIIQRNNHMKLHKMALSNMVMLGKDKISTSQIIGRPFWTTYKLEPVKRGEFNLTVCNDLEELSELVIKDSGEDNRNICDDGSSQMLSKTEILDLRDSGLSSNEILGQIVGNSKTFMNKTEFSQQKYLKKKEKKYFDYVTVRKPTIRLVMDILHNLDPSKLLGLRMDTLSQIPTAIDMHSNGTYILYESGCQGIVAAAMLNCLSDGGNLIHIHPGYTPPKQAVSAMNFDKEQIERLLSVNIHSVLRQMYEYEASDNGPIGGDLEERDVKGTLPEMVKRDSILHNLEKDSIEIMSGNESGISLAITNSESLTENDKVKKSDCNDKKRKMECEGEELSDKKRKITELERKPKKAQWEFRTEKVANLLKHKNADGLVIVAKEHPINIIDTLLPYIGISKPFIVFSSYREVLQELYIHLKSKFNVADLWLTETWIRDHQVLPERTHPDVMMSGSGGYLLSGILVDG